MEQKIQPKPSKFTNRLVTWGIIGAMAGTSLTGCVSVSEYNRTRAELNYFKTRVEQMPLKQTQPPAQKLTRAQKLEIGFNAFQNQFLSKFDSQYDYFYATRQEGLPGSMLQSLEGIILQSIQSSATDGKAVPYEFTTTASNLAQLKEFASFLLSVLERNFGIKMKVEYRAGSINQKGKTVQQTRVFAYPLTNAGALADKLCAFAPEYGAQKPVMLNAPSQ